MSLEATENECAAVAVAPRVSLADIEGQISERYEFTARAAVNGLGMPGPASTHNPLELLSICLLVMSIRQLWPLMGFALRDRLARHETPVENSPS